MDDAERGAEPDARVAGVLRSAVDVVQELVRALEGTSTRRVLIRVETTEFRIEREPGLSLGCAPASASDRPAASAAGPSLAADATCAAIVPIVAPLVGVFYRAASPGSKPYIDLGDQLEPGQVIGIVEAMKVMNQVICEQAGTVVEILVDDGTTVQYEQPLVLVDTYPGAGPASHPDPRDA